MRQIDSRPVWLGHAGDLRDVRTILSAEIEAVVELAANEPPALLPRELIHIRFPLTDDGGNREWLLRLAIQTVAGLVRARVPTLVCCSNAMSRSISIVAGGLAFTESASLQSMLTEVNGSGPADVSPALLAQVREALAGPL
jgi:hypothetical protein